MPSACKINGRTAATLCLLVVGLQVLVLCNAQSSESGRFFMECGECPPGEICAEKEDGTKYCKKECLQDCTGVSESYVCASNGKTYQNSCEMEKAACEENRAITVEYPGHCITLPPLPEPVCTIKQDIHDNKKRNLTNPEFFRACNLYEAHKKALTGTLELADLKLQENCHRPRCTGGYFDIRQCSGYYSRWCWCTSPDGLAVDGSLEYNMPEEACEKRKCGTHSEGSVFPPSHGCGLCQCMNGTITCYENYIPDDSKELNSTQLSLFQDEILRIFYFQFTQENSSLLVDIRHIYEFDVKVPKALKREVLEWKFKYYDNNEDGALQQPEQFLFTVNMYDFLRCNTFSDHVIEIIDENNDNTVSKQEWIHFFTKDLAGSSEGTALQSESVSKRSARKPSRKALSLRKKFYYTLQ